MRVVVVGASGGIGSQVAYLLRVDGHEVYTWRLPNEGADSVACRPDAIVCCNGSHDQPMENNFGVTWAWWIAKLPRIFVAMSGGGVGGAPSNIDQLYRCSKIAIVDLIENESTKFPDRQLFAVAPGLTATKMTGYKGADPRVPAAFIVKLLSGKYGHLSGSLLAAQRDDLDTMKPMKLRRVEA